METTIVRQEPRPERADAQADGEVCFCGRRWGLTTIGDTTACEEHWQGIDSFEL